MITNGLPLSKTGDFTGLAPRDIYRKIDFIDDRGIDTTARREGLFEYVDWQAVGRCFATDSQTLHLNWPNMKTRSQIAVQHLCIAHSNTGYIMAAHLGLDPDESLPDIEEKMLASDDFTRPRAFRDQARVWSQTEFLSYIDKITREVAIHPMEAPDVDLDLQLPHRGALIRQDILQIAHAFYLRKCLGKGVDRFIFVLDADSGLALAFVSAFATWIERERVDVIVVQFDKSKSNDQRSVLVAEGKAHLEQASGIPRSLWATLKPSETAEVTGIIIQKYLSSCSIGEAFPWPFHAKSEQDRRIRILTDRQAMDDERRARLMWLATLRSVDSYFHKLRSSIRFAARPAHTPSGNGRAWDRHYLYNPETMEKIIEIYRFVHNWMGTGKTKETPAMKLGVAKGKIYPKDLFA